MPSESILKEKKKIVEEMTERLKSKAGVFVDYKGITVNEDTEMRVKMRQANVDYSVIKNRLMKLAIKNVGFDELDSILVGTTSLAICNDDSIAPARIIKEYADKLQNYFEIKAGFMDGKVLTADEVNAIARIPALPVLQAQFLGTLLAPITSLAVVLKAIAEKGGAPVDVDVDTPEKETLAKEAAEEAAAEMPGKENTDIPEKASAEETVAETPVEEKPAQEPEKASTEVAVAETPTEEKPAQEPEKTAAKAPAKKAAVKKVKKDEPAEEETPQTKE